MCDSHQPLNGADSEPLCLTCGEPETGELGWFDDSENQTVCQRCGSDPTKKARRKVAV